VASEQKRRGRPRILDDAAILDSALRVFAVHGYEGMSLRSLNSELGLSHGTINQRFGTKEQLYLEAVDHGFSGLLADMRSIVESEPLPGDPLDELQMRFRAFLLASARRPHLNRLINNEGVAPSPMLDHIFEQYIAPAMRVTTKLMRRLADDGVIDPVPERTVLFVLANGAGGMFSLPALAAKFDPVDGPLDPEAASDAMAAMIVEGMRRHSSRGRSRRGSSSQA
jgi:TetR/AcrR family transcriptional regulator